MILENATSNREAISQPQRQQFDMTTPNEMGTLHRALYDVIWRIVPDVSKAPIVLVFYGQEVPESVLYGCLSEQYIYIYIYIHI
jgi:hypothetical protein